MTGKQLRNSILQWAIQGKLVPQDPNDEPASVLLERIRAEKARLVKEKKIKKDKNESIIFRGEDNSYYEKMADGTVRCIDSEIPFEIPASWGWCRMQNVIEFVNGRAYKKEELLHRGKYKVLRVGNFFTNNEWYYSDLELPEDKYCYDGDMLYAWSASFGPQIWHGDKTIFHYHIWNVKYNKVALLREYLYYFFLYDKTQVLSSTTGSTMIHVSMENMKPRFIPIPPYDEQLRIVEKVDRLIPIVSDYEKSQASLDELNNEVCVKLKSSILQEAIRGRLVPQIESEGTAEELLEEIRAEKKRLVKEGKLKKSAFANDSRIFRGDDNRYYEQIGETITEINVPFELPTNWVFTRLGNLCQLTDGDKREGTEVNLDAKYLRGKGISHIAKGRYIEKGERLILVDGENSGEVFTAPLAGYMGSTFKKLWIAPRMQQNFILLFIRLYKELLRNSKKGAAIPHLNKELFYGLIIGIPPIKEQIRIGNQVSELFNVLK